MCLEYNYWMVLCIVEQLVFWLSSSQKAIGLFMVLISKSKIPFRTETMSSILRMVVCAIIIMLQALPISGTYVNGELVGKGKTASIRAGDRIGLGRPMANSKVSRQSKNGSATRVPSVSFLVEYTAKVVGRGVTSLCSILMFSVCRPSWSHQCPFTVKAEGCKCPYTRSR